MSGQARRWRSTSSRASAPGGETLAYASQILAMTGQEAGLAGQISTRSERPNAYWTLRFGLGFDEATPGDFIEVDQDLTTLSGEGMANPAYPIPPLGSIARGPMFRRSFTPTPPGLPHWRPQDRPW